MHVYVCLFACMLGREVNKEKKKTNGTSYFEVVFAERCQKKNEAISCYERCCLTNCSDCDLL